MLGRGDGSFDPPLASPFANGGFRPYWLRIGDMDGDSALDAVIGGIEGSLVACRGLTNGRFDPEVVLLPGTGRPLGIALGDYDEDGRLDVATSIGKILINDGLIFAPGGWQGDTKHFNAGSQAWAVEADDLDADGHLDLMVALTFVRPDPIGVYFGHGNGLLTAPTIYAGPDVGVVALSAKDMDGDGVKDIVVGNRCAATVIIMRGLGNRAFEYLEIIDSHSVEDVEVADLNKDGKPDIVGVGVGLWYSINGGTNHLVEPRGSVFYSIPERAGLFINELMALNTSYQVTNSASPDWIEIYNHNTTAQSLSGWALAQYTEDGATNRWNFPATNTPVIPPLGHLVVYCSNKPGTNIGLYANFELSADGENLALLRPDGAREDFVAFPAMPEDVSYARTSDGARFMAYNPSPTLGAANQQPANLEPTAERKQPYVGPGAMDFGLNARLFDDVAIAYAAVCYRVAGSSNAFLEITMNDDGAHGDKLAGDGYYGAFLPDTPAGTEIEYYVRAVDLEGQTASAPKDFENPTKLYRIKVPAKAPALRLTELVPSNSTGLRDERNQVEDWIEVWNSGGAPVALADYALSLDYFDRSLAWNFPPGRVLQPKERAVVFCDEDLFQGPLHASFKLTKSGDRVFLIKSDTWTVVDSLSFEAMPTDTSFGVVGTGTNANWLAWPTPGAENLPIPPRRYPASTAPEIFWRMTPGIASIAMRWLGPPTATFQIETSHDLQTWQPAAVGTTHLGEGLFQWTDTANSPTRFHRVRTP